MGLFVFFPLLPLLSELCIKYLFIFAAPAPIPLDGSSVKPGDIAPCSSAQGISPYNAGSVLYSHSVAGSVLYSHWVIVQGIAQVTAWSRCGDGAQV